MKNLLIVCTVAMVLTSVAAMGQTATPRENWRHKANRVRIFEGRQDGEITNREAAALNFQQFYVRRNELRAKADGEVTIFERVRIERQQNNADRSIRRAKHNFFEKQN